MISLGKKSQRIEASSPVSFCLDWNLSLSLSLSDGIRVGEERIWGKDEMSL
jgi:hypothetical protein